MIARRIELGWIHLLSSVVCTPLLIRVCYVLISQYEYRKYDCFRIISQLLFFHIFCGLSYIFYGLGILLNSYLFGFVEAAHIVTVSCFCTTNAMNAVLAFNRMTLICRWHLPIWLSPALQIACWLEFAFLILLFFSPFKGMTVGEDKYLVIFNPHNAVMIAFEAFRFYSSAFFGLLSMTLYVVILAYLAYHKYRFKTTAVSKAERIIAFQAGLTFLFNFMTAFAYFYCYVWLMERRWTSVVYVLEQMLNFMYLPLIVYLAFNKKLRYQTLFKPCAALVQKIVLLSTKA